MAVVAEKTIAHNDSLDHFRVDYDSLAGKILCLNAVTQDGDRREARGVSQVQEHGVSLGTLLEELLRRCLESGIAQLTPVFNSQKTDQFSGPASLLLQAFDSTSSLGSTRATLAMIDNTVKVHGMSCPMINIITVGDCRLIVLRRLLHENLQPLEIVFASEVQLVDTQTPWQIVRMNKEIDDQNTREVIAKGSTHFVQTVEGDLLILATSDMVDSLSCNEVVTICNSVLQAQSRSGNIPVQVLRRLGKQIADKVAASVVVAEVVEWCASPLISGARSSPNVFCWQQHVRNDNNRVSARKRDRLDPCGRACA